MQKMAAKFNTIDAWKVATIDPVAIAPWKAPMQTSIKDKEDAINAEKHNTGLLDVYTDASVRNGRAGIGVFITPNTRVSQTRAQANAITTVMAELAAIWKAIHTVKTGAWNPGIPIRISTDSKAAVRNIAWPQRNQN